MDKVVREIVKQEIAEIILVQAGIPAAEREALAEQIVGKIEAALAIPAEG